MSCQNNYDIDITRGTNFDFDVALTAAYTEIIAAPASWQAKLVLRADQDDSLTPFLTLTAAPEILSAPLYGECPIIFRFSATNAQTQALPDYDIVHFVELWSVGLVPSVIKRLFQGKVRISD